MMKTSKRYLFVATIGTVLGICCVAFAGGGNVHPSGAKAKGYSLIEMAAITAYYNSFFVTFGPSPKNPPPDVPFQILVADATVSSGTWFYVPLYYADDAGGAPPGFPTDIDDQDADAKFLEEALFTNYQVTALTVVVDGDVTALDGSYISGVTSPVPLVDGSPPGSHYICSAAFLTPLSPGAHEVQVGGIVNGEPVVFLSYAVTVGK
jgi:hypothetical protein